MNSRNKGTTGEIWKEITEYEGLYAVSCNGSVRSLRSGRNLTQRDDGHGYSNVTLTVNYNQKNKKVHRLVAEEFIPNPENKKTINHIDGNKNNNNITNLEWATYSENHKHAYRTGLKNVSEKQREAARNTGRNTKNLISKIRNVEMIKDGIEVMRFESGAEAGRYFGVTSGAIFRACKNKGSKCKGYEWRYCGEYKFKK